MKENRIALTGLLAGVLAIIGLVLISSTSGYAACPSTPDSICDAVGTTDSGADCDSDGYTDFQECNGITLPGSGNVYPGYTTREGLGRPQYLDPAGPDLFFFLVRATPTLIPISSPAGIYSIGLNVTTHEISESDVSSNRLVTSTQKAVRVTESLDTFGTILGAAWQGTPNDDDGATVYTQRIANFVSERCTGASECNDASGMTGIPAITDLYIRNVIAHESGHVSNLAPEYSRRFEWHYAAGSGTVMEQSAAYTSNRKTGAVTFYISQQYTGADIAGVTLK